MNSIITETTFVRVGKILFQSLTVLFLSTVFLLLLSNYKSEFYISDYAKIQCSLG
jgi:hypothetical protein